MTTMTTTRQTPKSHTYSYYNSSHNRDIDNMNASEMDYGSQNSPTDEPLKRSKSKDSGNSAVMSRAREYNRMIEDKARNQHLSGTIQPSRSSSNSRQRPHTPNSQLQHQQQQQQQQHYQQTHQEPRKHPQNKKKQYPKEQEEEEERGREEEAIVTPELLVDALSGHEDGLLAIAERLMEHYDEGYDAMGESIIDAFADVQKLFQHVVEAAHMEGAAYEAKRKEEELNEFKKQHGIDHNASSQNISTSSGLNQTNTSNNNDGSSNNAAPHRHEEFVDDDVRELLQKALHHEANNGNVSKEDLVAVYENACNSASSLLPVDSDHRGRLQLSISRAESMSADRACTILKYAMDDVLRSHPPSRGMPISQRGDCVLDKKISPSINNLVAEMKDILAAPAYNDSPVQSIASQFFSSLDELQKNQKKEEERLEHKLATLKGEYLLAREEWEEKYNAEVLQSEEYRIKYERLLKQHQQLDYQNESFNSNSDLNDISSNSRTGSLHRNFVERGCDSPRKSVGSVASMGSRLSERMFSCNGLNNANDSRRTPSLVSSNISRKSKGGVSFSAHR